MESTPQFSLVDIIKTITANKRVIYIVTAIALAVTILLHYLAPVMYKAQSEIVPANPRMADRSNLYSTTPVFVDYYGGDEEIDKVLGFAYSRQVTMNVIQRTNLGSYYKLDINKPKELQQTIDIYQKRMGLKRTQYKNVEVSYLHSNPEKAAEITNIIAQEIEKAYRGYYNEIKQQMIAAMQAKINYADSTINALTDTLGILREYYKIYDILSASRATINGVGSQKSSGVPGYGKGIEIIQNIETVKDGYLVARSEAITLLNQFSTGIGEEANKIPFVKIVSEATVPVEPNRLSLVLKIIAALFISVFFTGAIVVLNAYFKKIH